MEIRSVIHTSRLSEMEGRDISQHINMELLQLNITNHLFNFELSLALRNNAKTLNIVNTEAPIPSIY
jgi:hypothetical protein